MPARRQVQHRVPPVQVRHPLLPGPVGDPAHPHPPQHRHHRRRGPLPAAPPLPVRPRQPRQRHLRVRLRVHRQLQRPQPDLPALLHRQALHVIEQHRPRRALIHHRDPHDQRPQPRGHGIPGRLQLRQPPARRRPRRLPARRQPVHRVPFHRGFPSLSSDFAHQNRKERKPHPSPDTPRTPQIPQAPHQNTTHGERATPIRHHPEIGDHPGAVRDRARQISRHPAPVMHQEPRRRQRPRQAARQARLIGQVPQQHQPGMRHDALTAAGYFQAPGPPGSVHAESAPRTRCSKDFEHPHCPSSGALFTSGTPPALRPPMKRQG